MLDDWLAFGLFLTDGRICLTNNFARKALRGIALGRKSWLFAGSDRGSQHAAFMYSLIVTAKLDNIDPQAWLADVLTRIAEKSRGNVSPNCCLGTRDHRHKASRLLKRLKPAATVLRPSPDAYVSVLCHRT